MNEIDYGDFKDFKEQEGPQAEGSDEDELWDCEREWVRENKPKFLVHPEPDSFVPPAPLGKPVDLKADHGHRGLQIIIKLANIHLTPEKSKLSGRIVARRRQTGMI